MKQRFRTGYDFGDTEKYSLRFEYVDDDGVVTPMESMTSQDLRDSTDVNKIVERWKRTGVLEHAARFEGQYGNFVGPESYHEAANRIAEANSMFETLPAEMRAEFSNDVGEFLTFVSDDENLPRMREMGLLPKQAEPAMSETESSSGAKAPAERAKRGEAGQGDPPGRDEGSIETS